MEWYNIPGATGYQISKDGLLKNPARRIWPGTRTTQGYYERSTNNVNTAYGYKWSYAE